MSGENNVVNILKNKKTEEGRQPLFVSHGRVRGPTPDDFGDRLTRIRTSLEKINKLMIELKKMDKTTPPTTSRLK